MKVIFRCCLFLLFGLILSGCSTLINGSKEQITFQSNPSNAIIRITDSKGLHIGDYRTPAKVTLDKGAGYFSGETYKVRVEKQGYQSFEFLIDSRISGWYVLGNLLIGGVIGWLIIDPISGGMWVLETKGSNVQKSSNTITIALLENVNPADYQRLRRIY